MNKRDAEHTQSSAPQTDPTTDRATDRATIGRQLAINCDDGVVLQGRLFEAEGQARGSVLIAGALGVPQRYYRHLASWLARQGWRMLTFDYRGCGESEVDAALLAEIDFLTWGQRDLHAALVALMAQGRNPPVHFIGHSMGSQLLGMSPLSSRLSSALFVGSSLPHWRRWPLLPGMGLWLLWHGLIPMASLGRERFPSRLLRLGSEDVPAAAMRQWARWCRDPDYLFAHRFGIDTTGYAQVRCPILSLHFADDGYASEKACRALLDYYPTALTDFREIEPAAIGARRVGHFGLFRPAQAAAGWPLVSAWLHGA